jgi:hypothetical protein
MSTYAIVEPPAILKHLFRNVNGVWYLIGSRDAPVLVEDEVSSEERDELVKWQEMNWDWEAIKEYWWNRVVFQDKEYVEEELEEEDREGNIEMDLEY